MHLVDKEDDATFPLAHLGQYGLEAFLEFAAKLCPGKEGTHVESENGLVLEPFRHVPPYNSLSEAFHDGCLPHPGLTYEYGVVLGLAGEDANDASDLGVATDDGIELAGLCLLDQIDAVFLECTESVFGSLAGYLLPTPHFLEGLVHLFFG